LKGLLKSRKAAEYVAGEKVCLLTFQQVEQSVYIAAEETDDTAVASCQQHCVAVTTNDLSYHT
jgi:hypothetical protein